MAAERMAGGKEGGGKGSDNSAAASSGPGNVGGGRGGGRGGDRGHRGLSGVSPGGLSGGEVGNPGRGVPAAAPANAAPSALGRAAPNARAGRFGAYSAAVHDYNAAIARRDTIAASRALDRASRALAAVSSKPVSAETVEKVNQKLGLTTTPSAAASIAAQVSAYHSVR